MLAGMAAPGPVEALRGDEAPLGMPDTSIGPVALQEPAHWSYDFDPATGASRASYPGEVAGGGSLPTTGTGSFVLQTSPTIITPTVNGATLFNPTLFDGGYLFANGITFNPGAGLTGVANASNAVAGQVGEYIAQTVLAGVAVPLTNAVPATITSISLTAGDWDVSGCIAFTNTSGQASNVQAGISTTPAALPTGPAGLVTFVASTAGIQSGIDLHISPIRISIAATTTVYLVGFIGFPSGTAAGYGFIRARRAR